MSYSLWPSPPSLLLTITALILFGISSFTHSIQLFKSCSRSTFFIPFVIGCLCQVVGYAIRIESTENDTALMPYIFQTLFILIGPIFYAASMYKLLALIVDLAQIGNRFPLKSSLISKIFITSDVISFFVQSGGGGLQASQDSKIREIAMDVVLVGLIVQIFFFSFFFYLTVLLDKRTNDAPRRQSQGNWRLLLKVLEMSSFFILVRSIYRVVEFGGGYDGYVMSHEIFFYVFDALMMLAIQIIFNLYHPGDILKHGKGQSNSKLKELGLEMRILA